MIEINLKGSFSKTPIADNFAGAFVVVGVDGGFVNGDIVTGNDVFHPTLYLDSNVVISSGTGQKGDNAYKLSL